MIGTLATFADQVTSVAREVGVEGKLGGQAKVPGAAGIWRDLTDNVNQLAQNLTTQVRAIAEVATAVTKGDLTRSITVEAQGEVAALKDNINEMIRNLKDTTQKNTEQDWLKTNLAKFTRMLQGQRDFLTVSKLILSELAPVVNAQHGVFYLMEGEVDDRVLKLIGSFAYKQRLNLSNQFKFGEGVVGQCALEKERILLTNVPHDYIKISSGLGEATPYNMVVLPVLFEGNVKAVIELASFQQFNEIHLTFLDQLTESIGIVLNTIAASMRTEDLLKKSQSLTQDLQSQQDKLQKTNEELEEKAKLLSEQKAEVETKNREVEMTKRALEEKAEQLSLTSKYKSEFLANMSHELRTPLNSLLILAKMLSENSDGNLTEKQVEFSNTIHAAGTDLLGLISEILDLSKIEAGKMAVDVGEIPFLDLQAYVERNFRQVAKAKGLDFSVNLAKALPIGISTDSKRLQQVIKNLLSNAFKFTERGSVSLTVAVANEGWSHNHRTLSQAKSVIAFSVTDTGIGIPRDKQLLIFEAFQQADGTTSRKYGGTGLGLTISREISALLGGEIKVTSDAGRGSTFTFYLPQSYIRRTKSHSVEKTAVVSSEREEGGDKIQNYPPLYTPEREVLAALEPQIDDDRGSLSPEDNVVLIVDDDQDFARILLEIARQNGFKGIISLTGGGVMPLVKKFRPSAITLDIKLPDIDGWVLLDRLKHDSEVRHIPVNIISGRKGKRRALKLGALTFLEKPVSKDRVSQLFTDIKVFLKRKVKSLLLVEDDERQRTSIMELVGAEDVITTPVGKGQEALSLLRQNTYDCMVLDLGLPDISGFDLLEQMEKERLSIPTIIYTGRELTRDEEIKLKRVAETIIVKDVCSADRLLDETSLFCIASLRS